MSITAVANCEVSTGSGSSFLYAMQISSHSGLTKCTDRLAVIALLLSILTVEMKGKLRTGFFVFYIGFIILMTLYYDYFYNNS